MWSTLFIVTEHSFLYFPIVLGAYLSISLMKVPDLSIESSYVAGSILGAQMLMFTNKWPLIMCIPLSVGAGIIGGMLAGLLAALLTSKARFPHLLSSILTTGVFHGLNQFFLGTSNISLNNKRNLLSYLHILVENPQEYGLFAGIMTGLRRHPEIITLGIVFSILVTLGYFFLKTEFGTSLSVYGNNPRFFDHYGIASQYIFVNGLLLSNGLAGLAGFFDAQASGFVDISMGTMKVLFCITSIILGKALIRTKKPYSILVPIAGIFAYFLITQCLLKVHFNLKYYTMVQSVIVAIILAVRHQRQRTRGTHQLGV